MNRPASGAAPAAENWLGQDDVPWNILLVASLEYVPEVAVLRDRLARLAAASGWPPPGSDAVCEGETETLLRDLSLVRTGGPVSVGRTSTGLVVRAHHASVDGLGLLAVIAALTDDEVWSSARGTGDRRRRSTMASVATRLLEVLFHPPASVSGVPGAESAQRTADVVATATVQAHVRTVDLVHGAVHAVVDRNTAAGGDVERVAVAVGVSTTGGREVPVGDHSGFLRFTSAESLGRQDLSDALRTAPLQVGGTASGGAAQRGQALIRWASRVFAPRLGSTLLVSHLGRVTGAALTAAAFYPMAGGGSGVSVGAVTVGDTTTITMRGRGHQHTTADLEDLMSRLVALLG